MNTIIIHQKEKNILLVIFLLINSFVFAQNDVVVSASTLPGTDSIYFHEQDASAIFGDAYINSTIGFRKAIPNIIQSTLDCNKAIETNQYGHNMFFKGQMFEVTKEAKFLGEQVLTFENVNKQTIYNEKNSASTDSFRLTNFQINNPKGIEVQNENIKVSQNFNFYKGRLFMTNNALELLDDAMFTCFSPTAYVVTSSDAKVIKSKIFTETNIPIGTMSTIAMAKINLKPSVVDFPNHRVSFNVDSFVKEKGPIRYDESADLQWKIKNLTTNDKITIDSLKIAVTRVFLDKRVRNSNFVPSSAFISQWTPEEINDHGGDSSFSNWDAITIAKYSPRISYVLPYAASSPMTMYRRTNNLDLANEVLDENRFTLTNLNSTPLGSKILGISANPTDDSCVLDLRWKPTDVYYSDLTYTMYLTNDNKGDKGVLQPLKPADIRLANQELYTKINLNSITGDQNIFTTIKPMYLKLIQNDKFGTDVSSDYTYIPVTCSTKLTDIDATKDIVVYAERSGTDGINLFVEYMSEYTEDISFKLYNILGMEEADLGTRTMINKPNKLSFSLPGNITRNQRYILVIYGGILNPSLTRKALSVFIP